jgi:serine/threonine protein phosphatase PrpC
VVEFDEELSGHPRSGVVVDSAPGAEAFGASLPQHGRSTSEDAFLVHAGPPFVVALADGAGPAELVAGRLLRHFAQLIDAADESEVATFAAWSGWLRALDGDMLQGAQSTLVALAVLDGRILGAAVGDSRACLWTREGELRVLTEGADSRRLGSRAVEPLPIHLPFFRGDILLLLSDGAWAPLPLARLRSTVARFALADLGQLPGAILTEASITGRPDDMTVVAVRRH